MIKFPVRFKPVRFNPGYALAAIVLLLYAAGAVMGQLAQSSTTIVNVAQSGTWNSRTQDGAGTAITSTTGALDVNIKSGSFANTTFGISGGVANIGLVRIIPSACTQSTNFASSTVAVATGAGTSITSTATCVTYAYANNITNSAVTLRLADKSGTPIIWFGGNNDFSLAANSNIRIPVDGLTFVGGITAIAGTSSAINLQINGLQ